MLGVFLGVPGISLLFQDQGINTTPKLIGKTWGTEFLCVFMRDYARKSLFILQWNNIITKLHSSVTLTVHQSGKCQIHRVSQREVGWNCCYIKVTMLLCFKHAAILQSVNDAGVLIDIHSTVLWNQKSPLYTCLCYRNNSRL